MDSTLAHHFQCEGCHLHGLRPHDLVLFDRDEVEQEVQVHCEKRTPCHIFSQSAFRPIRMKCIRANNGGCHSGQYKLKANPGPANWTTV